MRFVIQHHTHYQYSQLIQLCPQILRFYPRDTPRQRVVDHSLQITPNPSGSNDFFDLEGNWVRQVWFEGLSDSLDVQVEMTVDTEKYDTFDYFLESRFRSLPIVNQQEYSPIKAYLRRIDMEDSVTAYAAGLSIESGHQTLAFLDRLNNRLHCDFHHIYRHAGPPQTPAYTLQSRQGACRDLAVLFVDCCRAEGIAARFVSGYQRGNTQNSPRHLHAWPEVFLPGAGWCAYDPTHGLAVSDTHVTIAAAACPEDTMPVTGSFIGNMATSTLDYQISIFESAN